MLYIYIYVYPLTCMRVTSLTLVRRLTLCVRASINCVCDLHLCMHLCVYMHCEASKQALIDSGKTAVSSFTDRDSKIHRSLHLNISEACPQGLDQKLRDVVPR